MRRNYIMDTFLLFISLLLIITGAVLWAGGTCCRRGARHSTDEEEQRPWRMTHRCASLVFLTGVIVHLCWHWSWIEENTPKVLHGEDE